MLFATKSSFENNFYKQKDYKHYWKSKLKWWQRFKTSIICKVFFIPNLVYGLVHHLAHTCAHTLNRLPRERATSHWLLDQTEVLQLLLASAGAVGKGNKMR